MILFYPTKLKGYARVKILCDRAGIPYTENLKDPFTIVFNHDHAVYRNNPVIQKLRKDYPVINGRCYDVSKERVNNVHSKIFGYDMAIDPESYTGAYVRKTNLQGDKSGKVFKEPQKKQDGYIYQRLINNIEDGLRIDYRVYVINWEIVCIRKKFKKEIFKPEIVKSEPAPEVFGFDERKKILEFCDAMGVDYCELDILRENALYIVDVNDIPGIRRGEDKQKGYNEELEILTGKFKDYVDGLEIENKGAYNKCLPNGV